jgi:hypothetical protein
MCVRQPAPESDVNFFNIVELFTSKLGGPHNVTPWENNALIMAAALQACAEDVRSTMSDEATATQHLVITQLEEMAEEAVTALRLPGHEANLSIERD